MAFNFFGKGKDNNANHQSVMNPTTPATGEGSAKLTLTKATESLDRHIINLKKDGKADLTKHRARIALVLDRSISMDHLYASGAVQEVLTRLLPLANRFDDNGEMAVFLFHNSCTQMSAMTMANYQNYVNTELRNASWGGTRYAPPIKLTTKFYNDGNPYPTFVIFITDGANDRDDRTPTDAAIRESSKHKIFYQFVGIGGARFDYLEKLDNLDGRAVDNTAFLKVADFKRLSDDELYEKLLEQYIPWLKEMHII